MVYMAGRSESIRYSSQGEHESHRYSWYAPPSDKGAPEEFPTGDDLPTYLKVQRERPKKDCGNVSANEIGNSTKTVHTPHDRSEASECYQ